VFILLSVATRLASHYLGSTGVYTLATIMGVTDIDPFILSLIQYSGQVTAMSVAALAIIIAAASNNVVKGVYAILFGDRRAGLPSLICLGLVGILGIVAFLLMNSRIW